MFWLQQFSHQIFKILTYRFRKMCHDSFVDRNKYLCYKYHHVHNQVRRNLKIIIMVIFSQYFHEAMRVLKYRTKYKLKIVLKHQKQSGVTIPCGLWLLSQASEQQTIISHSYVKLSEFGFNQSWEDEKKMAILCSYLKVFEQFVPKTFFKENIWESTGIKKTKSTGILYKHEQIHRRSLS